MVFPSFVIISFSFLILFILDVGESVDKVEGIGINKKMGFCSLTVRVRGMSSGLKPDL